MANTLAANTTDHPNLTQVLVWTPKGLFDFKARAASGSIAETNLAVKQAALSVTGAANKAALKET